MDNDQNQWRSGFPVWGVFLLVLGLAWLLGEMGIIKFDWKYMGPIAVMFAGLSIILGRRRRW